jgi:hypothetical protein
VHHKEATPADGLNVSEGLDHATPERRHGPPTSYHGHRGFPAQHPGDDPMPASREFRTRILLISNTAGAIFDLAGYVEPSDLRMPLERLGNLLGTLLNDIDDVAHIAESMERLAVEDIEDAESRRLAATCGNFSQ